MLWDSGTIFRDLGLLLDAHFGTFGSYFGILGHPGRPWEQQEGHVGIWIRNFVDSLRLRAWVF